MDFECIRCHEVKPEVAFYGTGKANSRSGTCIKCAKLYHKERRMVSKLNSGIRRVKKVRATKSKNFLKKYGVTMSWYERTLAAQGGVCGICKKTKEENTKNCINFAVDHNHENNVTRGVLCSSCNTAIGLFKENTAALASAIDYLNRYSSIPKD